jgi:hypothetical protein
MVNVERAYPGGQIDRKYQSGRAFLAQIRQDTKSHCSIINIWKVLGFREKILGLYKDEASLSASLELFFTGDKDS